MKAYDSAYPGSMHERKDGDYILRDDQKSLAEALLMLIESKDREIEDLRHALQQINNLGGGLSSSIAREALGAAA